LVASGFNQRNERNWSFFLRSIELKEPNLEARWAPVQKLGRPLVRDHRDESVTSFGTTSGHFTIIFAGLKIMFVISATNDSSW
jgi:hypothetical protein